MKAPTALQRETVRSMAVDQAGRLESYSWYSNPLERNITVTTNQLAGLVERGLITAGRQPGAHRLTPDGLAYAIRERFIDPRRADELEQLLRPVGGPTLLEVPSLPAGAMCLTSEHQDTGDDREWLPYGSGLWKERGNDNPALTYFELVTQEGPLEVTAWAPGYGPAATTPSVFPGGAPVVTHADGGQEVGPYTDGDTTPMVPRDSLGRPVRPGYVVIWGDRPERWIVASWGRYNGGEDGWEWMLRLERERRTAADREGLQRAHALASVCRVIERAVDAPESRSTDELLHRLRELVAARQGLASRTGLAVTDAAGDSAEWVGLFDELDYRMSRTAYPLPGAWTEHR